MLLSTGILFNVKKIDKKRFCPGSSLTGLVTLCTLIEVYMIRHLTKVEIELCNALSPETQPVPFKAYNWLKVCIFSIVQNPASSINVDEVCCMQVFAGMFVDNLLYPVSAIYSHIFQTIEWSGVHYKLRSGKIYKVTSCGLMLVDELVSVSHLSWLTDGTQIERMERRKVTLRTTRPSERPARRSILWPSFRRKRRVALSE